MTKFSTEKNDKKNQVLFDMTLSEEVVPANSMEELLSHEGSKFISCAYLTILNRSSDIEGMKYYKNRISIGVSKIEILSQLYLSKEAKKQKPTKKWLRAPIRTHLRYRNSIANKIGRLFGSRTDDFEKKIRSLECKTQTNERNSTIALNLLEEKFIYLDNKITDLKTGTNKISDSPITLPDYENDNSSKKAGITTKPTTQTAWIDRENILQTTEKKSDEIIASVIILTKNPGVIFKEVLTSVINQITPWNYEILVIDSGSTDGTIDFVRQHRAVRLIEVKPADFGHGKTRNYAVYMSKGKYAAMLTHDAKPLDSNWLANLVKPLEKHPTVAGVFGRHRAYPDHTPYIKRDMEMHFDGFLQWPAVMGMEDPERYARDQGYRQLLHFFSDNNACLRKTIWEKIPYPDVNFAEDQLWAKAIIEAGYKRAYANDAVVYHSHDYSIKDTFRRSFDESRALKSLLGYDLCPTAGHGLKQIFACAKSDLNYLSTSHGLKAFPSLALKTPLLHTAKQTGWYIGRYQGKLKSILFWLFSLDGAKKRKSNMSLFNQIKSLFSKSEVSEEMPIFAVSPDVKKYEKPHDPIGNKTDVIGFYDFVITEDKGTLPQSSTEVIDKTINWMIPDFGIGSGGHLNIFRFINMLEKQGYKNTICIIGNHKHLSPEKAQEMIWEHFFKLDAEVVLGVEDLQPARYSFATSWITAYALRGFSSTVHKLYFVQDFEPAFYSHGSEYDFAEETYKFGFTGICAGSWLSEKLKADYGMNSQSVGFSYDRDLYQQTTRREPHKQRVFCYCRPPTIRRGWESAMLALSLVGQKMPDVEFIFAGWDMGNYYFPYPHLNGGVCSLKELPDLFSQCDVALVFSFTNLSLLPLELMSCGCVVVSNKAPNTEWLLNDENSILPKSSSPRSISDSIIEILQDNPRRIALAARAKDFASQTNWDIEGLKMAKIISQLDERK